MIAGDTFESGLSGKGVPQYKSLIPD